jgi:probable addiction module antidote protein
MKKLKKFSDYHVKKLQNKRQAIAYLSLALEEYEKDHDKELFLRSLRDVVEAQGGIGKLSEKVSLSRQSLYKSLSPKGNPQFDTIGTVLQAMGMKLSIELISKKAA